MTSPMGRRVVAHWADPRPAWLWSRDGSTLIWRNAAARLFSAKLKKGSVRLAPEPIPIKGLVARLIRLGSPGRSSLSRVQFLSGGKPVAATCSSTPIALWDGEAALLLVGVDPIPAELSANADLPPTDALEARVASHPDDLEARFDLASALIARRKYEGALEHLLGIVQRDRTFRDDIGRKTMLSVFDLAAHQPELVSQWRRKLSAALY